MQDQPSLSPVVVLGDASPSGAYLLRIAVTQPLSLAFGRFKGGRLIDLPAGEYLYIGSARGTKGAASLAHRLVRHATRSGARPPHPIRAHLIARLQAEGLGEGDLWPKGEKRLRWHIDYLLDQPAAELTHVVAVRTAARLETALARQLARDAHTAVIAKGLGAGDARGSTHLLRVVSDEAWWRALPETCERLLQIAAC